MDISMTTVYTTIAFYVVYAIMFVIVCYFLVKQSREIKSIKDADQIMKVTRSKHEELVFDRYVRECKINRVLSGVLIDLAHAENPEQIDWKLHMIRRVEMVMSATGHYGKHCDAYDWMIKTLESSPPDHRDNALRQIREAVTGYYIMDSKPGKDFISIIESIASFQKDIENCELTASLEQQIVDDIVCALKLSRFDVLAATMYDCDSTVNNTPKEDHVSEKPASETTEATLESETPNIYAVLQDDKIVQGEKEKDIAPKIPTPQIPEQVDTDDVMVIGGIKEKKEGK